MQEINLSRLSKQRYNLQRQPIRTSHLSHSRKKASISEDKLPKQVYLPRIYDIAANAQANKRHQRYKTDFTKDVPRKVAISMEKERFHQQNSVEDNDFNDIQMKELNDELGSHITRKLSKINPKSMAHKKLSYQFPTNFEKDYQQQLQAYRRRRQSQQNHLKSSILHSQFQGRIRQQDINFKPSLWKSYQFQKVLRNRLKTLFKMKQKNHLQLSVVHAL